jgi:hypothetical protein
MIDMTYLTKEDKERIAMGLVLYKQSLNLDPLQENNELFEYNIIECSETNDLAERLGLDKEYYEFM